MAKKPPILFLLAGPNGAGKSTLYEAVIRPAVKAEFINADIIEAQRKEQGEQIDSYAAARIAAQRRDELIADKQSFVTETVFSHESKNQLIEQAKEAGFQVVLYHVNVNRPDLSVARVERRVEKGGHPVPENKIRERYERNQPLIRQAARDADRAYIYDNSTYGREPRLVAKLVKGQAIEVNQVPKWARELYRDELATFSQSRINDAAASFKEAEKKARALLSPDAEVEVGKRGHSYEGPLIAATRLHLVQRIAQDKAVAHFTSRLPRELRPGHNVKIEYPKEKGRRPNVSRVATRERSSQEPDR